MMAELEDAPVNEWRTKALLREHVRRMVATMVARQEAPLDEQESSAYLANLDAQRARIIASQRSRDWCLAAELSATTAPLVGVQPNVLAHPVLAREFLAQTRALLDLALQVERDCDDPLSAGRSQLENVGLKPERSSLKSPMQLSAAIEKACEETPPDVEKKIRAVGDLALAFFGDVPVATVSRDQAFAFLKFVWNMPNNWGQLHGKNRHEKVGSGLDPHQIKGEADAEDKAILDRVLANASLSFPEKRRRLVEKLRPRLTDGYLFVQRDMFNRIVRAALGAAATGRDLDDEDRRRPVSFPAEASTPHVAQGGQDRVRSADTRFATEAPSLLVDRASCQTLPVTALRRHVVPQAALAEGHRLETADHPRRSLLGALVYGHAGREAGRNPPAEAQERQAAGRGVVPVPRRGPWLSRMDRGEAHVWTTPAAQGGR